MKTSRFHHLQRRVLSLGILCGICAAANAGPESFLPADYRTVDGNHINFASNSISMKITDVSIGSEGRKLSHTSVFDYDPRYASYPSLLGFSAIGGPISDLSGGTVAADSSNQLRCPYVNGWYGQWVQVGTGMELFCQTGSTYYPSTQTASTLTRAADGTFTYMRSDGTAYTFAAMGGDVDHPVIQTKVEPNGLITQYHYTNLTLTRTSGAYVGNVDYWHRLQSVTRNDGLQLQFQYASNVVPTSDPIQGTEGDWFKWLSTIAVNNSVDYCDPTAGACSFSNPALPWPQSSYQVSAISNGTYYLSIAESSGATHRFTVGVTTANGITQNLVQAYKPPTSTTDAIAFQYCQNYWVATPSTVPSVGDFGVISWVADPLQPGQTEPTYSMMTYTPPVMSGSPPSPVQSGPIWLCSVVRDGAAWQYGYGSVPIGPYQSISGKARISPTGVKASMVGPPTSIQMAPGLAPAVALMGADDEEGNRYIYDRASPSNRLQTVAHREGNYVQYDYDARGNVKQVTHYPKPGSTQTPLYEYADYDLTCVYPARCNKPNWTKDANGNQTDYTYDPIHGGVLTKTLPAVLSDNTMVRPQTRYGYVQRYAWYKNAAGTMTQAASPIWVLDRESYCKSAAAPGCIGTSDEVVTQYDYGPNAGPNNLFLMGVAVTADGVTRRTCYSYDRLGNKISETTPNAGQASCPGPSY